MLLAQRKPATTLPSANAPPPPISAKPLPAKPVASSPSTSELLRTERHQKYFSLISHDLGHILAL